MRYNIFFLIIFLTPGLTARNRSEIEASEKTKPNDKTLEHIKALADQYSRPFTFLDIKTQSGYYGIKIAESYPCVSVMIESDKNVQLQDTCRETELENVIVLQKKLSLEDLQMLAASEHFDIVLASNVLCECEGEPQEIIDTILSLGDFVFFENCTSSIDNEEANAEIEDYLHLSPLAKKLDTIYHLGQAEESIHHLYLFSIHKNILQKPYWDASIDRNYIIISNFREKYLLKPPYHNELKPWKPGINLWTFKNLEGSFPETKTVKKELKKCFKHFEHAEFTPWNLLVKGKKIRFINKPNKIFISTDDACQHCLETLGLKPEEKQ